MPTDIIFELLARGAAAGLNLMLAITFLDLRNGSWAARLGCLFATGVAAYALVSSNLIAGVLGPANYVLNAFAISLSVFFWWFATSLFDDRFRWRWWRFLPLALVSLFATAHFLAPIDSQMRLINLAVWQALVGLLMGHAALLALMDLRDDLVEPRRRFRVTLAALVGLVGITFVFAELSYADTAMPAVFFQLQAAILLVLSILFSIWVGRVRSDVFVMPQYDPENRPKYAMAPGVLPEDKALARMLDQSMQDGLYRQAGLTVGVLANRLSTPEHRLRKLINQGLGFRNFSSFLNQHRIADAQSALADPDRAREQILTLALELGYGSIAPFNRAFREITGTTPTAYRKQALANAAQT